MWVVGDEMLNSTVQQFMNWCNNQGKHHYLNRTYEVTPYTVAETNNFLAQIQLGLVRAINANNYLPGILLVILGNSIQGNTVLALKDEFYIKEILKTIKDALARRRDQLPKKAKNIFNTKIIITKALPKPEDQEYKIRRRRFNKTLDVAAKQFNIEAMHVCDILPTDKIMFEGPDLSETGKKKFWMMIGDKIKDLDLSDQEALTKRRKERLTGEIGQNPNNLIWLNSRRRLVNRNEFLGIEVEQRPDRQQNINQMQREGNHRREINLQNFQRQHRVLANGMEQLNRQNLIQEHMERRRRRYGQAGRFGAAEWYNVMSFIQNMNNNAEPNVGDGGNQYREVFQRQVGRMMQSGDGRHINLYRNHARRN